MTALSQPPSPSLYYDKYLDCNAAKILPGEYYVTAQEMVIVTVLGSCVSACVRDRLSGIGGMNHFMLPESVHEAGNPASASARYGTYAMEVLLNDLAKLGAKRGSLEAKVFGGGNVLRGFTQGTVGERNAAFVQAFLSTEGIRVVAEDLLDVYPRKVYFFPRTGKVLVKKLRSLHNDTIMRREREYSAQISHARVAGEVELFA